MKGIEEDEKYKNRWKPWGCTHTHTHTSGLNNIKSYVNYKSNTILARVIFDTSWIGIAFLSS